MVSQRLMAIPDCVLGYFSGLWSLVVGWLQAGVLCHWHWCYGGVGMSGKCGTKTVHQWFHPRSMLTLHFKRAQSIFTQAVKRMYLRAAEVRIRWKSYPKAFLAKAMAVRNISYSFVEVPPVELMPQDAAFRQHTGMCKHFPSQILVFDYAISDRHAKPRKHYTYETIRESVTAQ